MPDEAAGGADCGPSATAGGIILVVSLPRELRAGGTVSCTVADVEEALERAEGDRRALKREVRLLDKVEDVKSR